MNWNHSTLRASHRRLQTDQLSMQLIEETCISTNKLMRCLAGSKRGLTENDAQARLKKYGKNIVSEKKPPTWYLQLLLASFNNPFIYFLLGLTVVSYLIADIKVTITLTIMVVISGMWRFVQKYRSTHASKKLKALTSAKATVIRRDRLDSQGQQRKIPIEELVPGDIVQLAPGDIIPADVRLLFSKDLFVSQALLSGEFLPVEKYDTLDGVVEKRADAVIKDRVPFLDTPDVCFMGSNVISGTATAVVVATGDRTYFGSLAKKKKIVAKRNFPRFEKFRFLQTR